MLNRAPANAEFNRTDGRPTIDMRPVRVALLFALLLAPLLASAPTTGAQAPVDLWINVVSARSVGCSPDSFTSPDLRVLVFVNDAPAFETVKAQDQREPLYATLTRVSATLPARIRVEVEEAEPSGLFGTTWVRCDTGQGTATSHTHTYAGGAPEAIVALGDGERAAEAVLAVGRVAPTLPEARATNVTATSATLSWALDLSGETTGYRIALAAPGPALATLGRGLASADATDLCDNQEHTLRVVRDAHPWAVASDVTFRTANVAPAAPRVLAARNEGGNLTVEWEASDLHDAARFEVLVGASREPTDVRATVDAEGTPFGSLRETVALRGGDAWARVRLVDTGGLSGVSEAYGVDAPAREADSRFARLCEVTVAGGPASSEDAPILGTPTTSTLPFGGPPGERDAGHASREQGAGQGLLPDWAVLLLVGALGVALGVVVVLVAKR